MSVLVVGATGLLGTEICGRLADKGTPRRALVRETSDPARVEALRELGAELVVGDLRDRGSLDRACAGIDVVFSTATSIIREGEISAVDGHGQLNLVDAARDAGVSRFVFVSFEELGTGAPLERAKRAVEERLQASGITYTIVRAGLFHESWLSPATGFDAAGGTVNVYGSGEPELSWIAVEDVATAAVNALELPETQNAIVPIAAERLSYRDVIAVFEQATGRTLAANRGRESWRRSTASSCRSITISSSLNSRERTRSDTTASARRNSRYSNDKTKKQPPPPPGSEETDSKAATQFPGRSRPPDGFTYPTGSSRWWKSRARRVGDRRGCGCSAQANAPTR